MRPAAPFARPRPDSLDLVLGRRGMFPQKVDNFCALRYHKTKNGGGFRHGRNFQTGQMENIPGYLTILILLFRTGVSWQTAAVLSIFNGFFGAAADTGHTVGAAATPHRSLIFKTDIFHGTDLYTFPAGNAGICGIKFLCMYHKRIEKVVDNTAAQTSRYGNRRGGERLSLLDHAGGLPERLLSFFNNFYPCILIRSFK